MYQFPFIPLELHKYAEPSMTDITVKVYSIDFKVSDARVLLFTFDLQSHWPPTCNKQLRE